jgi:hypothetical protein
MTLTQHQRDLATQLGTDAGTAAAGWAWAGYPPSAASHKRAVRCIALSDDGDPSWHDEFGHSGWLSGEWADSDTPHTLAVEIGIDSDDDTNDYDTDDLDELADLYELAADAAYATEVFCQAHVIVDDGAI